MLTTTMAEAAIGHNHDACEVAQREQGSTPPSVIAILRTVDGGEMSNQMSSLAKLLARQPFLAARPLLHSSVLFPLRFGPVISQKLIGPVDSHISFNALFFSASVMKPDTRKNHAPSPLGVREGKSPCESEMTLSRQLGSELSWI